MSRARRRDRTREGLTLVEAAVLVGIVGVVVAVFVPTFAKSLRTSKVAEASELLEQLHIRTAAYYAASHGEGPERRRACLPAAAGPAPAEPSPDPQEHDFQDEAMPGAETWKALGFQPNRPIRYRYSIVPAAEGCGLEAPDNGPLVLFRAEGDLDGDGKRSVFEREASVGEDGTLVPVGILHMLDRVE